MRPKTIFTILFFLSLIFITMGDQFLPQPLSDLSRNTRVSINKMLIGLFPKKEFKNPNKRTEDAVEQLEQKQ
ncbi:MAG: hypothetical protein F6K10_31760 [Moorea sp. SIO2B7]|nr:hypothetical protein [Moorena sp. SIO2B7]